MTRAYEEPALDASLQTARPVERSAVGRDKGASPIAWLNLLLRNRWLVLSISCLAFLTAAVVSLIQGARYAAESQFKPQSAEGGLGTIPGLASQLGINIIGAASGESIEFYAELLRSRELLRQVVSTTYRFATGEARADTLEGTLVELLRAEGDSPQEQQLDAIDLLLLRIAVSTDVKAGIVTLRTTAPWPELAVLINRQLLDLINEFNVEKRQSQAAAERQFIEARMREGERELRAAESELRNFLEQNRRYDTSPELAFEAARLQRQVDLLLQVYISLAQSYEKARIDEVRNIPVITIVDSPEGSERRLGGNIVLIGLFGLILGALFSMGLVFAREYFALQREEFPEEYREFDELRRTAAADLALRRLVAHIGSRRNAAEQPSGD